MDYTKFTLKMLLGSCFAGLVSVIASPQFALLLALVKEPWRSIIPVFLGGAVGGGVMYNARSPREGLK